MAPYAFFVTSHKKYPVARKNKEEYTSEILRAMTYATTKAIPHLPFDICGCFAYPACEVIFMTNTRSSGMHIRVNPEIKASVEPILAAIGLSFSDVFNLTLRQIYLKRKLPFELSSQQLTENGYTAEFEAELLAEIEECYDAVANGAKTYSSAAELRAALDAEGDDE